MKVIVALSILFTGGCGIVEGTVCDDIALAGIRLSVVDSLTAGVVTAPEVIVKAATGSFTDSIRVSSAQAATLVGLAHERPGTYTVDVTATGYATWRQAGVRVTEDECHVRPVTLVARLRRS